MHRIPLIVGNWKMYKTPAEAKEYIAALAELTAAVQRRVYLAVPFTALESSSRAAQGSKIAVGAQNMHDESEGAFTGEVSARMLHASGAGFVLLGHSERRQHFGERNAFIQRKIRRALQESLSPILCIGEQLRDRESGNWKQILRQQMEECLQGVGAEEISRVILAYEPVWAIGTGRSATPELAQEVHRFIRDWVESRYGHETSCLVYVLYGGSVKLENIAALMAQTDIDGVLVGGASLDVQSFSQMINY